MRASGEHNVNLFNEFNKFNNEPARIYHIPQKTLNCKKRLFLTDTPIM